MFAHTWMLALCGALFVVPVAAQDDPELGDTGSQELQGRPASRRRVARKRGSPPPQPTPAVELAPTKPVDPQSGSATARAEASTSAPPQASSWERPPGFEAGEGDRDEGTDESVLESDHEAVVGSFSVGILGLAEVPVGVGDPLNATAGSRALGSTLTAPVLGSRYWFTQHVGLEAGLGFMFRGGTIKRTGASKRDGAKASAFAVTLGVPISLKHGKHYNLLLIPYAGFGASRATDTRNTAENTDDVFGKGTMLEGGLKAGVEIQLGAIGLEGFALQLAAGVRLRLEQRTTNVPVLDAMGNVASDFDVDSSEVVFTTSPDGSLGSAVASSLAALYYF